MIAQNLLSHRQLWATQLGKLWFAEDYLGFVRSKAGLDTLLQQAQLSHESAAWSLDLLKRAASGPTQTTPVEEAAAWFTLALSALAQAEAEREPLFSATADRWEAWVEARAAEWVRKPPERISPDPVEITLFHHVVVFLEALYRRQVRWQACRNISELAYQVYTAYEIWLRVVHSLKSLAQCSFALGEKAQGEAYERQLLQTLPFEKFPPGFKIQLTTDIITAKTQRNDTEQAQALLDELKATNTKEQFTALLDKLQADITLKATKPTPLEVP